MFFSTEVACECGVKLAADKSYSDVLRITCPRCLRAIPLELVGIGINDCTLVRSAKRIPEKKALHGSLLY